MLIILMDEQILSPTKVCPNCLFADQSGQPRWRQGKLCCGHVLRNLGDKQATQYECQMGFRVANIE